MKPTFLFALLLFYGISMGQNSIPKKNIKQYNHWINLAELAVCDQNFENASIYYDEAFKYHRPYAQDAFFAFRVNYEHTRDTSRILDCVHYLVLLNNKIDWIIEDSINDPFFYQHTKNIYDTTPKEIIPELNQEINYILKSDQDAVTKLFDSADEAYKYIDSVMRDNLKRIKNIYRKYPRVDDYTVGRSITSLNIPFNHFYKNLRLNPKNSLLKKEVKNGNYNVQKFIALVDLCFVFSPKADPYKTTIYGTNLNWGINDTYFSLVPPELKKVQKQRRKVLTDETWEDYEKKIKAISTNQIDYYFYSPRISITNDDTGDSQIESLIRNIDEGQINGCYYHVDLE